MRLPARHLALPWETVRRQVAALAADGRVDMVDGSAIVPGRVIAREEHQAGNRRAEVQAERTINRLASLA